METLYRQLLLCASDPAWQASDRAALLQLLRGLGILGETVGEAGLGRHLIGAEFLQSFSFMGCSPSIEFEPSSHEDINWQEFVFIHLPPATARPAWLADQTAKPGCPSCGQRSRDWLTHYSESDATLVCPGCGQRASVCSWRWYDAGACARQFISVVNIFPREAMPTDALMQELATETGTAWQYFYLHGPLSAQF
jgi:hypothetical protein